MRQEAKERLNEQEDSKLRERAQQRALAEASDERQRTIHNENFLNELRDPDIDDPEHSDQIEEEFPSWFSGARAVTNRSEDWDLEADLIMQNKRERATTQRRPGRLLRDRPFMLAAMRGDESPQLDAYAQDPGIPGDREDWKRAIAEKQTTTAPVSSEQQARIYNAAEVSADLMTLSRDAAGLESVSTVKTETSVNREEESSSTASRVGRVLE
jgi:hypothetical protein